MVKLGLLSNEKLARNINWTLLSDPLYAAIERITDTVRLAPLKLAPRNARAWLASMQAAQRCDALFSMSGSWRTEGELLAVSRLAGNPLRSTFYVDPWQQELPKIRRGVRWFGIDLAFVPYREAFDSLSLDAPGRYKWLPFAADTAVFRDRRLKRDIDILWMGRRYEPLHQAMLAYAEANGLTYRYRENTGMIADPVELGKLAARSRYFVCTPSDFGGKRDTGGFSPLIMRYFEGLAAGCRLVGILPRSGEFEALLLRGAMLEVAPDGSDFAARFAADSASDHWRGEVAQAAKIVRREHGWDARARTIVNTIRAELAARANLKRA